MTDRWPVPARPPAVRFAQVDSVQVVGEDALDSVAETLRCRMSLSVGAFG